MKKSKLLILVLILSGSALIITAQDNGGPPQGEPRPPQEGGPGRPGGPGPMGRRMPPHPLMVALDTNGDGIIDEQEIANAPAALMKLDKNGDGKLTPDELRPPLPPRGERGPGHPGGPDFRRPPGDQQGGDNSQRPQRPPADQ